MSNEARIAELSELASTRSPSFRSPPSFAGSSPEAFLNATFESGVPAAVHVGCDLQVRRPCRGHRRGAAAVGRRTWHGGPLPRAFRDGGRAHHRDADPPAVSRTGASRTRTGFWGGRYSLCGTVRAGRGEGADMGFRTANLVVPDMLRVLGDGVYAAYALVGGVRYKAAVNVGVAATFADRATATCEAHLLDFEGDLYGEEVEVEFAAWLRPMRAFDDIDELIAAVLGNIDWVRENL